MLFIRKTAIAASLTLVAAIVAAPAAADDYPDHAVTIIVPFGVGGVADVCSREVALFLSALLRQAVVVENRAGGSAVIGAAVAAKSTPDGYTLLTISNALTANETVFPKPTV
jgi:tripartite-type tricarboxylate transporter receptor subunit TctC